MTKAYLHVVERKHLFFSDFARSSVNYLSRQILSYSNSIKLKNVKYGRVTNLEYK